MFLTGVSHENNQPHRGGQLRWDAATTLASRSMRHLNEQWWLLHKADTVCAPAVEQRVRAVSRDAATSSISPAASQQMHRRGRSTRRPLPSPLLFELRTRHCRFTMAPQQHHNPSLLTKRLPRRRPSPSPSTMPHQPRLQLPLRLPRQPPLARQLLLTTS